MLHITWSLFKIFFIQDFTTIHSKKGISHTSRGRNWNKGYFYKIVVMQMVQVNKEYFLRSIFAKNTSYQQTCISTKAVIRNYQNLSI
jgi:hypothetical protein